MNAPTAIKLFLCSSLMLLHGCSRDRDLQRSELDEIAANHAHDVRQIQEARAEFARRNPMPQKLEFPGQGMLLVHECSLEGYPGRVELWIRYTYVNTTGHTIDAARITIAARDPESHAEWSETTELRLPAPLQITRDSSYTTYAHVPTRGMHSRPKWGWTISAQAVTRE